MEADPDFTALLVKLWKNSPLFQVNRPLAPGGCKLQADGKLISRALLFDVRLHIALPSMEVCKR
jgi:hypothetical protein